MRLNAVVYREKSSRDRRPGRAVARRASGRELRRLYTDGDLRPTLEKGIDIRIAKVAEVMTRNPHAIAEIKLAAEAVQHMERFSINGLLVLDGRGCVVGALNIHDLIGRSRR